MRKYFGYSLIELMVASFLGFFLLSSLITIYLNAVRNYQYIWGLARIEENSQIAFGFLTNDIHAAGFFGCLRGTDASFPSEMFDPINHLQNDNHLSNKIWPNTDTLVINKSQPDTTYVLKEINTNRAMSVNSALNFKNNDGLVISNCEKAQIFRVNEIQHFPGFVNLIADRDISDQFGFGAEVHALNSIAYFIADTGRKNSAGDAILGLYREDLLNSQQLPNELLEGIDNMKITYGIRDGQPATIVENLTGAELDDLQAWSKVVSVKISLLLNSIEPVFSERKYYEFQGKTYLAKDRELHKQWNKYIAIMARR